MPPLVVLVAVLTAGVVALVAVRGPAGDPAAGPATDPATGPDATSTAPPAPVCDPAAVIDELPLRARLAQLLVVGVGAAGPDEALAAAAQGVGGLFLTGSGTGLLTGGGLAAVQAAATVPLSVAVDDEGGRVQRLDALEGDLPSARVMAATLDPAQVRALARERGAAMRARGVTVDFAPSVDVGDQPDRAVIGDRSFGADAGVVTAYAGAFAGGLREAGVLPVFKHFPGHGRADGDSHDGPVVTPPLDAVRAVDLEPYRALLDGAPAAVMLGHLDVPGLTAPGEPASVSPAAVRLLREEVGFDGLVVTDDLSAMGAITSRFDLPEAVRAALAAGADVALLTYPSRLPEVLDVLERAVTTGALPPRRVDESLRRVLVAKGACERRPGP